MKHIKYILAALAAVLAVFTGGKVLADSYTAKGRRNYSGKIK